MLSAFGEEIVLRGAETPLAQKRTAEPISDTDVPRKKTTQRMNSGKKVVPAKLTKTGSNPAVESTANNRPRAQARGSSNEPSKPKVSERNSTNDVEHGAALVIRLPASQPNVLVATQQVPLPSSEPSKSKISEEDGANNVEYGASLASALPASQLDILTGTPKLTPPSPNAVSTAEPESAATSKLSLLPRTLEHVEIPSPVHKGIDENADEIRSHREQDLANKMNSSQHGTRSIEHEIASETDFPASQLTKSPQLTLPLNAAQSVSQSIPVDVLTLGSPAKPFAQTGIPSPAHNGVDETIEEIQDRKMQGIADEPNHASSNTRKIYDRFSGRWFRSPLNQAPQPAPQPNLAVFPPLQMPVGMPDLRSSAQRLAQSEIAPSTNIGMDVGMSEIEYQKTRDFFPGLNLTPPVLHPESDLE